MDTWWIDKPHLLGSSNPTDADLEELRREGFSILVSLLCEETQPPRYDLARVRALGFERYNIPVADFQPPADGQLEQFVNLISGLPSGAKTIIHCQAGIGRTGTFAAAYLITTGMSVPDAIAYVRKLRQHAVETSEQEGVLKEFGSKYGSSV